MSKIQELLKKLGVSKEIITAVNDGADFDVDTAYDEADANIRKALMNDSDFIDPLRVSWQAEVLATKERQLVKASNGLITQAEVDALPKKDRINAVVELLSERAAQKGGDTSDKDKEILRIRTELQTALDHNKELMEVQLPKVQAEAKSTIEQYELRKEIAKAIKNNKTVLDFDKTVELLYGDATSKYDLGFNEQKQPIVYTKGTTNLAYGEKDKSKPLGLEDIVPEIGLKNGYFVQNNSTDNPPDSIPVNGGGSTATPRYRLPGMAAAEANVKKQ